MTAPVQLDGHLDEAAWAAATPIGPLRQSEPREAAAASEATDVRVLYDADTLYIGIVCHEAAPDAIVSTQLTRDADLQVDDRITVAIDPFLDHRNGFFFEVNPAGARADGQITNNSRRLSRDWDGIWNASARVTPRGWEAELAIPFKTLRFKPGQTVWGFNVEREIKRRNEIDRWAAPQRNSWIGNMASAGRLTGLERLQQGVGLDIRPYVSGKDDNLKGGVAGGIDVFDNVTPNLNAALTVNTDFAETEADARQVNLTRFPLFYPEKRTFFLEGAGVFDVAGVGFGADLRPFFSRRIGLSENADGDNVSVPILAGTKITGRQSDYNIGVIDVMTRQSDTLGLPRQNLAAVRVSRNLFEQSWIGGIFTSGNPNGGRNMLAGGDARFATSTFRGDKNLRLDLFALATDDGTTARRDGAFGFGLGYPNDRWNLGLAWKQIGDAFTPALGFVPRTGIRKANLNVSFQPRPQRWGLRQLFFELRPEYITDLHNRVENWQLFSAPFNLRTDSGEHFEWNVIPQFEHLDEPFEIVTGVIIPTGSYQWTRYRAQVNTASKRRWVLGAELGWGGFYDGTRRQIRLDLTMKPSTHLSVSFAGERNDVTLPEGAFDTVVETARLDWNFSPNLSWANLVQYDNDSRIAGVQSRFRWILQPGNDLFVVLNRGWYRRFDGVYEPNYDYGSVKLQYTFRL